MTGPTHFDIRKTSGKCEPPVHLAHVYAAQLTHLQTGPDINRHIYIANSSVSPALFVRILILFVGYNELFLILSYSPSYHPS